MKRTSLKPLFVENAPDVLEDGVIYVSIPFGVAMHNCCCGCGGEVTTRISPTGWEFSFNGEDISVWPSVGPSTFKCKSHYVIRRGKIIWHPPMSDWQIEKVRERDSKVRAGLAVPAYPFENPIEVKSTRLGWLPRFKAWFSWLR